MKKRILVTVFLFLSLAGQAFSAEVQSKQTNNSDINQKACQNVFSFINIDLSVMSPRAAAADISVTDAKVTNDKKNNIVPIADKKEVKPQPKDSKNKTSLFRIDLLHIFKIQIM